MSKAFYLVAGLGNTGFSAASYFKRQNIDFALFDTRKEPPELEKFKKNFPAVKIYLEEVPEEIYDHLSAIIVSPGIKRDAGIFMKAFTHAIPVYGDIEYMAKRITAPVLAVTGTNGKSTVVTLLGEMAKAAGLTAVVAGNIGNPVLDYLDDGQDYQLWILELSSFQLELSHSLKPLASCILNVTEDHLDYHRNFENYAATKQRIYCAAKYIVFNREDENTKFIPRSKTPYSNAQKLSFGTSKAPTDNDWGLTQKGKQYYLSKGEKQLLGVDEMGIKGAHNWGNALAVCAMAELAGISFEVMIDTLKSFKGLAHRCQLVREIDNVQWINDSKGTNVGATLSAIEGIGKTLSGKIILIAGGLGKGADFTALAPMVKDYVRALVLIGRDAEKIAQAMPQELPVYQEKSLKDAVLRSRKIAVEEDIVLLSPACASQDMFKDFNDRGEQFTKLVMELP